MALTPNLDREFAIKSNLRENGGLSVLPTWALAGADPTYGSVVRAKDLRRQCGITLDGLARK